MKSIGDFVFLSWGAFLSDTSGNVNWSPTHSHYHTNLPNKLLIDHSSFKIIAQKL